MVERVATLEEIETAWSYADVIKACDILDAVGEARQADYERQRQQARRGG